MEFAKSLSRCCPGINYSSGTDIILLHVWTKNTYNIIASSFVLSRHSVESRWTHSVKSMSVQQFDAELVPVAFDYQTTTINPLLYNNAYWRLWNIMYLKILWKMEHLLLHKLECCVHKLEYCGVRGSTHIWINSWLSGCTQQGGP